MSEFKFLPWTELSHPNYNPLVDKWYFKLWNHWLNPLGNWHEPLPFPQNRYNDAQNQSLSPWLWWTLRNPFHNFFHFWIGITPIGKRYEWISPEENGWVREKVNEKLSWWKKKGRISLPHYDTTIGNTFQFYIGWKSRGTFGLAFRRN